MFAGKTTMATATTTATYINTYSN